MTTISQSLALLFIAIASFTDATSLRRLSQTYSQTGDYLPALLARVNKERGNNGLPPLCHNTKLQSSAQRHSNDMAAKNYMAHDGSDGSKMETRITDAGYKWIRVGENVAVGQVDVDAVMDAWMKSPEHKANILGDYTMIGAAYGYNENSDYEHFWTQDFGKGDSEQCDSDVNPAPAPAPTPASTKHNNAPAPVSTKQNNNVDSYNQQEQVAQNEDSVVTPAGKPAPKTQASQQQHQPKVPVAKGTPVAEDPAKDCEPHF